MGSEALVFTVGDVLFDGPKVIAKVYPPIPPSINLDQFLLRRYEKDGTSVILDLLPPQIGFGTTSGFIKNSNPPLNTDLLDNIDNITTELITKRIIS